MASSSTALLARYKPAILALTAITAGCAIFYIHSAFWSPVLTSPPPSQQTALHRSNAQRRQRRASEIDDSEALDQANVLIQPPGLIPEPSINNNGGPAPQSTNNHGEAAAAENADSELYISEGRETVIDTESEHSWRDETEKDVNKEGQRLLNLLYRIAEEQATKDGYIHRGVTCNSCNATPIRGVRYRCANCVDFDLCEQCEAMQIHIKTHLFYKVRIPAPFLGNPRQPQPVWYPGKSVVINQPLKKELMDKYCRSTDFHNSQIEALWEQFRCLAGTEWIEDPDDFHLAIDRQTFDKCFIPNASIRPPPPNLIYDRMFAFYDTNHDGLIGFEEFLKGLASLTKHKSDERRKRIFDGYDIDQDGLVDRKDFLRMFRAFYALTKELTKEIVCGMDEDALDGGLARDIVVSSQPISSAFSGLIPSGEGSRTREGKRRDENGDYTVIDSKNTILESGEDTGDHNEALADVVEAAAFGDLGDQQYQQIESMLNNRPVDFWPPPYVTPEDVVNSLNSSAKLEDIANEDDREKVMIAAIERIHEIGKSRNAVRQRGVRQRWQRHQFYLAEEDGALPPPGFKPDEGAETPPISRRSRSSSKVRFEDDLTTDDEHEIRSATSLSSRSIPLGERWGGYEVPEAEKDVGREILYQVTQESLNELLDPIFSLREDLAIMVRRTKRERRRVRSQILAFASRETRSMIEESMEKYQKEWRKTGRTPNPQITENPLYRILASMDLDPSAAESDDIINPSEVNLHASGPSIPETTTPHSLDTEHQVTVRTTDETSNHENEYSLEALNLDISSTSNDLRSNSSGQTCTTPINELSESSGYSIPSEPLSDPTLPQNRPNSIPTPGLTPSPPPQAHTSTLSTTENTRPPFSTPHGSPSSSTHRPLSKDRLTFLLAMDILEAEDEARGGPGRLSFGEFEEVLAGSKGPGLGFIGSWLEMASF